MKRKGDASEAKSGEKEKERWKGEMENRRNKEESRLSIGRGRIVTTGIASLLPDLKEKKALCKQKNDSKERKKKYY